MTDAIIVIFLVVVVIIAVKSSIPHFKGEGGCCGGGSSAKIKKKRLKKVVQIRKISVEGMTCQHCKNRVESRLNELEGVVAKVDLRKKTVTVSMERVWEDVILKEIIEKAGYEVVAFL